MKKVLLLLLTLGVVSLLSSAFAQTPDPNGDPCSPENDPTGLLCAPWDDPCMVNPTPGCVNNPVHCLAAGTEVMLSDGAIAAIEHINASQYVTSYTPQDTYMAATGTVSIPYNDSVVDFVSTHNHGAGVIMYELVDSFGNTLQATSDHPIITANRGAVTMASLQKSDTLITVYGESTIASLTTFNYQGTVHNLALRSLNTNANHTTPSFFANNILVGDLYLQRELASN